MITLRPAHARGHFDFGWLRTHHSFSFGDYVDPEHEQFRALRVINEDWIAPGTGFGTHPHRNMEILTWVLEGRLEHRDSLGHGGIIHPGEAQRMSAGSGIRHSEFNASEHEAVHLLQIWLRPGALDQPPGYAQKAFPLEEREGRFARIASPDGREGSLSWGQDAALSIANLAAGASLDHALAERFGWIQMARGSLHVNGVELRQGDGAALDGETRLTMIATEDAEVLLFDLP